MRRQESLRELEPEAQTSCVVRGSLRDAQFAAHQSEFMRELRCDEFHKRLQWDVGARDGLEHGRFDDDDSVYMLTVEGEGAVSGGWRLRPTTRGYMLSDIFPQLLQGCDAPRERGVWEISRFAIDTFSKGRTAGFSLGGTARRLLSDAVRFAVQNQISQYVVVVSVAVERLIASSGVVLNRFGSPVRIGRVLSVACWVDIDAHTRHIFLGDTVPLRSTA